VEEDRLVRHVAHTGKFRISRFCEIVGGKPGSEETAWQIMGTSEDGIKVDRKKYAVQGFCEHGSEP
jgi:hypothetical protein